LEPDGQQTWLIDGLNQGHGLVVFTNDTIYLTDGELDGIRVMSANGSELGSWSIRLPDDSVAYASPRWVARDTYGMVYVVDGANHRIKKFTPTGQPLLAWGSEGHTPGRFTNPEGIAVGPNGLLYVVDGNPNNRVQIFTIDVDGQVLLADTGSGEIEVLRTSSVAEAAVVLAYNSNGYGRIVGLPM
jgi:DNA-binding beta-propeller fold protein YncE